MLKVLFFLLMSFSFVTSMSFADVEFVKEKGKVEFKAKGWPSLLKINGNGQGAYGSLKEIDDALEGKLTVDLSTLETGITLRDDHLKNKYLKVKDNPTAELAIKKIELKGKKKIKFKAKLLLNGVVKPVEIDAKLKKQKKGTKVTANFKIKLSDFKVAIPSFKGVTVAEEVQIKVTSLIDL